MATSSAFKDLDSGVIETQDISALLGTMGGFDVQWLSDDMLFSASANPGCCVDPMAAHLVRVSRSDPNASRRSASGAGDLWGAELTISPDRNFLYANRGAHEILKLDLSEPDEPIVDSAIRDGSVFGAGYFTGASMSSDGNHIAFANRKVLEVQRPLPVGRDQWAGPLPILGE